MAECATASQWRQITCPDCSGRGVVSTYTLGGSDFLGPGECRTCEGNGALWVLPSDKVAVYPGGRWRGSWPGAYKKAKEV